MDKSKLDNQNSYNSLSFMAQALIPLIDNLIETNRPQHKLKFHINKMLKELEKLSVQKYKAFKNADMLQEAKSVAVNLHKTGSSDQEITKFVKNKYGSDIANVIDKFLQQGMNHEDRVHSFEDIMVITDKAYELLTNIINQRKANEVVSLITLYTMIVDEGISLEEIRTEYTPIVK